MKVIEIKYFFAAAGRKKEKSHVIDLDKKTLVLLENKEISFSKNLNEVEIEEVIKLFSFYNDRPLPPIKFPPSFGASTFIVEIDNEVKCRGTAREVNEDYKKIITLIDKLSK